MRPAPFMADPYTEQRHLVSHAEGVVVLSRARQQLAQAAQLYPAISAALLEKCGGRDTPRPPLSDFPAAVVCEASREVQLQDAVLKILAASARAEASGVGVSGVAAVAALGAKFDRMAAALILKGGVVCELSPLDQALGVFPIAQLALSLYFGHHCHAPHVGPDIVAISAALAFKPAGIFNPDTTMDDLEEAVHAQWTSKTDYDVSAVYVNVVRALSAVQDEGLAIYPTDGAAPKLWSTFARSTSREWTARKAARGFILGYTVAELQGLLAEIQDFAVAWRLELAEAARLREGAPTHMAFGAPSAVAAASVHVPGDAGTDPQYVAFMAWQRGQAAEPSTTVAIVGGAQPVRRAAPPGCPGDACHMFWLFGGCARGTACKYVHAAHPPGWSTRASLLPAHPRAWRHAGTMPPGAATAARNAGSSTMPPDRTPLGRALRPLRRQCPRLWRRRWQPASSRP